MGEYFFYVIAAMGAGIGTGLAGLSAATVMVPILIVLCPSFGGEYGAYQATAIALASDILGSAVTSATYARNKNIDLRHGWIMLVCIVSLSTVGSYVAYLAGNVVLGGFTLFLTFGIGIRFLVSPDTSREDAGSDTVKLDAKNVIISLFFGLTIGFGTGFVGTGGGMMMLVVFTVFLGYELKTAVGTSTFIMTFTALIAFISHVWIHPAIVMERWNVLIICVIVATISSLISAQFANRVSSRTVGLVTGVVLTILGASMIYLNYFAGMQLPPFAEELLHTLIVLLVFVILAVGIALILFYAVGITGEFRRKILHIIAFLLVTVMVSAAEHWYTVALLCLIIAVLLYPIFTWLEKKSFYNSLFQQRQKGETKRSLILLFAMGAVITALFWGLFGSRLTVIAGILVWGIGDTAAALIGEKYGRHKISWHIADQKKSLEGSGAMFGFDFLFLMILLEINGYGIIFCLLCSLFTSLAATFAELVTKNGYDTLTTPFASAISIQICLLILVDLP